MTGPSPDALRALLRTEEFDAAVRACVDATGGDARALRNALRAWIDGAEIVVEPITLPDGRPWDRRSWTIGGSAGAYRVAAACAFALAGPNDVRRNGFSSVPHDRDDARRVAAARGRRWATSIAAAFAQHWPGGRTWSLVRPWMRAGLCDRPDGDGYVESLFALNFRSADGRTLRDLLLDDPALLDDEVWRLFDVEGRGENSLAARDKYERTANHWSTVLAALAAEGRLPRDRVLGATLGALERDFAHFRAGWFSRFHDLLAPTDEELAARTDRYVRLLGSRVGPTVSMALRTLVRLDRSGRLPADAFLAAAPDALRSRTKATVLAVLRLLGAAARRDPSRAAACAHAAVTALMHESAGVQAAALDVIAQHGSADDPGLRDAIAPCAASISATLRDRLAPFAADAASDAPAAANAAGDASAPEREPPRDESRLAEERRVEPIAGFADLVACFAHLLEHFDADEFERVLDAVARLGPPQDAAQRKLAAPLARRAARLCERWFQNSFVPAVAQFAATWAGGTPWTYAMPLTSRFVVFSSPGAPYGPAAAAAVRRPGGPGDPPTLYQAEPLHLFFAARLQAVAESVVAGRSAALLSAPTHRGGWIDPVVLADRVRQGGAIHDEHDRVLALLRLAPERRAEALARVRDVAGEFAGALRHALGAAGEPIGPTAALWIASARARAPFDDDPRVGAVHPHLGPDAAGTARYVLLELPAPARETLAYPCSPAFVVRLP